jgi:fructose-bisphosphate aldolase class II
LSENPEKFDPRDYLKPARDAMRQVCKDRMVAFGQAGQASKLKPVTTREFAKVYAG